MHIHAQEAEQGDERGKSSDKSDHSGQVMQRAVSGSNHIAVKTSVERTVCLQFGRPVRFEPVARGRQVAARRANEGVACVRGLVPEQKQGNATTAGSAVNVVAAAKLEIFEDAHLLSASDDREGHQAKEPESCNPVGKDGKDASHGLCSRFSLILRVDLLLEKGAAHTQDLGLVEPSVAVPNRVGRPGRPGAPQRR